MATPNAAPVRGNSGNAPGHAQKVKKPKKLKSHPPRARPHPRPPQGPRPARHGATADRPAAESSGDEAAPGKGEAREAGQVATGRRAGGYSGVLAVLEEITVAADPDAWRRAGFELDGDSLVAGAVRTMAAVTAAVWPGPWSLSALPEGAAPDGLPAPEPSAQGARPRRV